MCYDVAYLTKKADKYAEHYGKKEDWADILTKLPPTYHASGFDEHSLPAVTSEHSGVVPLDWPFVPPSFTPKAPNGRPLNTLNARDDKIFTPRSMFRESAEAKRCMIMLDGFFDHHKKDGVAYPHYIKMKNNEPMMIAGLWQRFQNTLVERECVTLVTTRANKEMAWVHNEPAYSSESRMVFILPDREAAELWIHGTAEEAKELIGPLADDKLECYPCKPIKSNKKLKREYIGNVPEIQEKTYYAELEESQGSLF